MTVLESLNATTNRVLTAFQTHLPNPFVEPPHGTDDPDGYLAA
jgi:hypothetical protein